MESNEITEIQEKERSKKAVILLIVFVVLIALFQFVFRYEMTPAGNMAVYKRDRLTGEIWIVTASGQRRITDNTKYVRSNFNDYISNINTFGIGVPELIVLLVILAIIFLQIVASLMSRRFFPGNKILAVILCVIAGPFGHLYIKKWGIYLFSSIVVSIILSPFLVISGNIVSPLFMLVRIYGENNIE